MDLAQLEQNIISKKTFLCLGLDTDLNKIPKHLLNSEDPIFDFNKQLPNYFKFSMKENYTYKFGDYYSCYGT